MKPRKFYLLPSVSLLLLVLCNPATAQFKKALSADATLTNTSVPKTGHNELPASATNDWYSDAVEQIRKMENAFYPQKQPGTFRVANAHHQLGFSIHSAGYSVYNIRRQEEDIRWNVQFELLGAGRKTNSWDPAAAYTIANSEDMLRYSYAAMEVQYHNSNEGLRQNFIIREKPTGSTPLTIQIRVSGDLKAKLLSETQLSFISEDSAGTTRLLYDDLKVWDNHYQPLKASMQLENDLLTISVDDNGASYPITIDPVNKTPDWNTTANGVLTNLLTQLQMTASLYGYAVCGLGDVNNDGFGDVAVSAPAMVDVFAGTQTLLAVGAVFIYHGSPGGLSTTPAQRLQPNTAGGGAFFGLSMDAGDVTGDGIPDIVVGAPLDAISVSVPGLLGPETKLVVAGKVYIFAGSNGGVIDPQPSPLLEVKLPNSFFSQGLLGLLLSNIQVRALFGFSVAVTDDLNGDTKNDLIVGCPAYLGVDLLSVKNGAAFVYYSSGTTLNTTPVQLEVPPLNVLGLISLPIGASSLLYGFSVDGAGDFNSDGHPDVVVSAPAGINLNSLGGVLTGQVLGGSAYVYYGTGTGINPNIGAKLIASSNGLLGNAANMFGFRVKGQKDPNGVRTGNIIIGAPLGGLVPNLIPALAIKAGNLHVFKKKSGLPVNPIPELQSDQRIESPANGSIFNILNTLNINLMFGTALDNAYDVNGDTYPDLVVGEPLSSGLTLLQLQANLLGGSAYVYLGDGAGGYQNTPFFKVSATYGSDILSVNAASMLGYSVAGARGIRGMSAPPRVIVGSPGGALDFGSSILDLGSTLGVLGGFLGGNNGLGKAYSFDALAAALPVTLVEFKGKEKNGTSELWWSVREELNLNVYEVQRSLDGVHFETIGLVFPWDNNSVSNEYAFTDKKPVGGLNFYRLKSVDKDGSSKFSNIIAVRIGTASTTQILVAPNPVQDKIRVILGGLTPGTYRMELRNTSGQLQHVKPLNITQRDQIEYITRSSAATPGIYWLTVYDKSNKKIGTSRVIVQ